MTIPQNPYIAGNPVGGTDAFIGRTDVLRGVKQMLRSPNRNAIVLYGQRRIGKTSLLRELKLQLPRANTYHPVYVDLQDKAALPLDRLLQELAREISDAVQTKIALPSTGDIPTAFRNTYIPQILAELPADASLVLLLDEFDVLDNPDQGQAANTFFPYLRNFLENKIKRLQFVFVIGRKPDDLSIQTKSVFKGILVKWVSLLPRKDADALVRLSEKNNTLVWKKSVLDAVWVLTHGHPYLTQQLCEIIWNNAYESAETDTPPTVTADDVHAAVDETLEGSTNALVWLWDGLAAAEKYVAAVLAQGGSQPVTQEELEQRLNESGVRIVIHELQNAPQILKAWDLLEGTPDDGYRFRVELLRRWIAQKKPVNQVYQELESIEPLAQSLYDSGRRLYQMGQLDRAANLLQQAIEANPNHVRAGMLLAQIYLTQEKVNEAVALLERIYTYHPGRARERLVQALLKQAETAGAEDDRLALYEKILEISPNRREAVAGKRAILKVRADRAAKEGNLQAALDLYRRGEFEAEAREIERRLQVAEIKEIVAEAERLESEKKYTEALEWYRQLGAEYPEAGDWAEAIARLEQKTQLAKFYADAQAAMAGNAPEIAKAWLQKIVALDPEYERALEDLVKIARGVDIDEATKARQQLEKTRQKLAETQEALKKKESSRKRAQTRATNLERDLKKAKAEIKRLRAEEAKPVSPGTGNAGAKPVPKKKPAPKNKPTRRLSPWNPPDYGRLLWWMLVMPQTLKAYKAGFGEDAIENVGKWLAGFMTWLPFLTVLLAIDLGFLPLKPDAPINDYWIITAIVALMVLLTGIFGDSIVVSIVAFGVAVIVVVGVVVGVASSLAGVVAVVVAFVVVFVVAGVVAGSVAVGVASSLAVIVAGGTATVVAGIDAGGLAGIVAFFVAVFVAGVVGNTVEDSVEAGTPHWLPRTAFGALAVVYPFLIWFSFFGGWQYFS